MSVRRSKFEYILTLGWKNRGMERLSWSKYSWNRAWILNLTHRIFSRERPETKTIWADGARCELLFHADLERNRAEMQRTERWWGEQGENETKWISITIALTLRATPFELPWDAIAVFAARSTLSAGNCEGGLSSKLEFPMLFQLNIAIVFWSPMLFQHFQLENALVV